MARPPWTSPWAPTSPEPPRGRSEGAAGCLRRERVRHVGQGALRFLFVVEVLIGPQQAQGHPHPDPVILLTGQVEGAGQMAPQLPVVVFGRLQLPVLTVQYGAEAVVPGVRAV